MLLRRFSRFAAVLPRWNYEPFPDQQINQDVCLLVYYSLITGWFITNLQNS